MTSSTSTGNKGRTLRGIAAVVVTVVVSGLATTAAQADPQSLPPLDHAAVLSAAQAMGSTGVPAFLVRGTDESGDWSAAVGTADLGSGAPVDPAAAFRIGSISKMFVSVAILKLVDEGKIGLDTPVSTYLPGLLKRGNVITIRMLLQHRAGLGTTQAFNGNGNTGYSAVQHLCNKSYDPVDVVRAADVQLFEPGTSFNYANAGYTALGLVIEKVTGRRYEQVLRDKITVPLGLQHTSFQDDRPVWPGSYLHGYTAYKSSNGATKLTDVTDCKESIFGAAGSGISNTRDLTTFMQALVHGTLLPSSLYAQMIDGQDTDGQLPPYVRYGLGILVETSPCGVTLIGHDGVVLGYQTNLLSTLDGSRMTADVQTVLPGSNAADAGLFRVYNAEYCGGN